MHCVRLLLAEFDRPFTSIRALRSSRNHAGRWLHFLEESGISVIAVSGPAEGIILDRAIDSVGHRAHLQPHFRLNDVHTPADHLIGPRGGGKALAEACFTGTAPIVGIFAVRLMCAAFDCALNFAKTEKRGGAAPIISHQAVGYALADAKMAIEAVRSLSLRAAHAFDTRSPSALELALAKVFGSETAVRVISDLMCVVGIDSYDRTLQLGGLLADALVYRCSMAGTWAFGDGSCTS